MVFIFLFFGGFYVVSVGVSVRWSGFGLWGFSGCPLAVMFSCPCLCPCLWWLLPRPSFCFSSACSVIFSLCFLLLAWGLSFCLWFWPLPWFLCWWPPCFCWFFWRFWCSKKFILGIFSLDIRSKEQYNEQERE